MTYAITPLDTPTSLIVGRGFDHAKLWLAKNAPDETPFTAGMRDGIEAGYKLTHKNCGGDLDLFGLCWRCNSMVFYGGWE